MFVLCMFTVRTKGKSQDIQDKEVRRKYKGRIRKKFRCGRDILHQFRLAQGPTQPHIKRLPGLFAVGKATGACR